MIFLTDPNFDYNDQLARRYLKYNNIYYDIGTKVKLYTDNGVNEAVFTGWRCDGKSFEFVDGSCYWPTKYLYSDANSFIVEIIEPIYPQLEDSSSIKSLIKLPELWEIETGLTWYIIIMAGGIIFKGRLLIWTVATAIFILWIFGFLKEKKE